MTNAGSDHDRSDFDLWHRLLGRDPEALGELFDRHQRPVYNFCFRRTASWSAAEDLTQATFTTLWRRAVAGSLPETLQYESALPWILGIADGESRNAARSRDRRDRLHRRIELVESAAGDPADEVAGRLDDERRMRQVRTAVSRLPEHERVTIEFVVWAGLSVAEAAAALGLPAGTVKSRLFRARTELATTLAQLSEEGIR